MAVSMADISDAVKTNLSGIGINEPHLWHFIESNGTFNKTNSPS